MKRFEMTALGLMSFFLGMEVQQEERRGLQGFPGVDWAGSVEDMGSTSGFVLLWDLDVSPELKETRSGCSVPPAGSEMEVEGPTEILVDNQAALAISQNHIFHGRTKHFKIKFYYPGKCNKKVK
ncbi:hypothetical protein NL676_004550 [Syzygium grande]|nr:hypothetical protein NL676_004550 [Syzygium grande]